MTDFKVGDKVAVFPIITDGTCNWCEQESYGLCPNWGFLGYSGFGGGMAEYIVVDRKALHKVPDHVPLDVAALVEPLAVGWHAVKMAKPEPGDCCLVLGAGKWFFMINPCLSVLGQSPPTIHQKVKRGSSPSGPADVFTGPIGLAVIHALVAHNITNIIVSEPSALRASQAKAAGATHVVSPREVDVPSFVQEHSLDNGGAHSIYECAGIQAAFHVALTAVRGRGIIVNVAIYEATSLEIPNPNTLNRRQITIVGSNTYTRAEFDEVIAAIAEGRIKNPEAMITGRVPLERAVEDGFKQLVAGVEGHVKILVDLGSGV